MVAQTLHSTRTCGVFVTFVHRVCGVGGTGISNSFKQKPTSFALWIS